MTSHATALGLLLAAVLALAAPAHAILTDLETADLKRLVESSQALRTGERYLANAIHGGTTSASRPALHTALAAFHGVQQEHRRALSFFLHIGIDAAPSKPNKTPAQWHTGAWFYLDRYRAGLGGVQKALTQAKVHTPADAAYQDSLRRAGLLVATAQSHAGTMNKSLPYTTPWPALRDSGKPVPFTVPTVVGPHGDYREMQWLIGRGKNYALDTYLALLIAYKQNADGKLIRDAWVASSTLLDIQDRATALLADVTFTAEEAGEDRFCRALRVRKLLGVNAAVAYQRWGDAIAVMVGPPYGPAMAKLVDSWKHGIDWPIWQGDVFPESTRCSAPFLKD